jgi:uncharacterized protein (TIGR00730 family)
MNDRTDLTASNFPTAQEEAAVVKPISRYGGPDSSYRLAFTDESFMLRQELRPVRLQLELLKPELVLRESRIESTIVLFGSARTLPLPVAQERLAAAEAGGDAQAIRSAQRAVAMAQHYEEARRFAALVTESSKKLHPKVVVCTGGGPGIMEAGNRGASEAGGESIGLNIVLPHEQEPNAFITPKLCFQFHYFAMRKMHFLMRSIALVCFPGGFGTLDELFEVLTLTQTGKVRRRPIILFDRAFWDKLIDFQHLVDAGMIGAEDLRLIHYVETAEEAWAHIVQEYGLHASDSQMGEYELDV